MLSLIYIILGALSLVFRKSNKCELRRLFRGLFLIMSLIVGGLWLIYAIDIQGKPDLNACRKERQIAQERMQQIKEELAQNDSLDEEKVSQLLEDYQKAEEEFESYNTIIEENSFTFEQGGIEKIEFLLFFNLF